MKTKTVPKHLTVPARPGGGPGPAAAPPPPPPAQAAPQAPAPGAGDGAEGAGEVRVAPNRVLVPRGTADAAVGRLRDAGFQGVRRLPYVRVPDVEVIEFADVPPQPDQDALVTAIADTLRPADIDATASRVVACPKVMGGGIDDWPTPTPRPKLEQEVVFGEGRGAGVRVVVVDTRPFAHRDFAGIVEGVAAPVDGDELHWDAEDARHAVAHSLFVAGTILRYAPGAQVRIVPVLDDDGDAEEWQVAQTVRELRDLDLLNLSLGTADELPLLEAAVAELSPKIGVVASAGNDNSSAPPFNPAAWARVTGVGAVHEHPRGTFERVAFSNFGPWVRACARGEMQLGPWVRGRIGKHHYKGWALWSGTSFSAPVVTAAAAIGLAAGEATDGADAVARVVGGGRAAPVPDFPTAKLVLPEPQFAKH